MGLNVESPSPGYVKLSCIAVDVYLYLVLPVPGWRQRLENVLIIVEGNQERFGLPVPKKTNYRRVALEEPEVFLAKPIESGVLAVDFRVTNVHSASALPYLVK
jgi:hypothetical protein